MIVLQSLASDLEQGEPKLSLGWASMGRVPTREPFPASQATCHPALPKSEGELHTDLVDGEGTRPHSRASLLPCPRKSSIVYRKSFKHYNPLPVNVTGCK